MINIELNERMFIEIIKHDYYDYLVWVNNSIITETIIKGSSLYNTGLNKIFQINKIGMMKCDDYDGSLFQNISFYIDNSTKSDYKIHARDTLGGSYYFKLGDMIKMKLWMDS